MKLEVGMYVRTDKGNICKIIDYHNDITDYFYACYETDLKESLSKNYLIEENILKASHNIIDLIEVGDYVNGKKVIRKWEEPFGEFVGQIFIQLEGEETIPTMRKIETIVTKEQFESISYKIGD